MNEQGLVGALRRNPQMRHVLEQLLEARGGAVSLNLNVWTFAVEMSDLLGVGGTVTLLRLLVGAGYVEHAEDVTTPSDGTRSFRPENPMKFGPQTCFVLTEAGVQFLEAAASPSERRTGSRRELHSHRNELMGGRQVPVWDPEARELRVRGRLVKRFSRPAPMLELVLAAFQEMEWPAHLDDPLPPEHGIVPEERLRDTVRRLNRCQKPHRIRFASDGLGAGIRWGWTDRGSGKAADEPRMSHG